MAELDFRALVEAMPDVLAVLDREQRYVFINAAVEHATGVAPAALIGKRTDEVMAPDDAAIWGHALAHVLATGESRTIECRFVTPRGPRVFAAMLTRIAGERVCVVSRDVSDLRSAERARRLRRFAAQLTSALTQEQIATITSQEVFTVLGAHACAASVRVGDEMQIIGAIGTADQDRPDRYKEVAYDITFEGRRIGSIVITLEATHELATDDRDYLFAIGELTAGALERARLSEAHQASEEQLRFALTAARAATWSLDLGTMKSQRDASYAALVGGEATRVNADFMTIHPDDRQAARDAYERALRERVPYEPEVRIRRDDGSYMWVRAHGRVICDADGKPRAMAGVIVDIDEARQANLRAETLHRLAASFASELDEDRLVQMITDEITKLIGAQVAAFSFAGRPDTITGGDPAMLADLRAERIASVLTVAVTARSGETFGTLQLGHADPGRFTSEHARLVTGIASHAAVALENAHLYKTVREQKEQLELAVERARLADRRKDEFLAMLGHEMRNPLAPIATALDLMELKDGADVRKERGVIRRQVEHLSRLIDDLLDVSRITRGKIQLSRVLVELGEVLAKAIEMASPLLEKRLQRLTVDVPRTGLLVDADPTRLAQVFQNLLTNASKYSEPRSHVELRARGEGDRVVVEVRDEGMGISPELLPRMFDMFAQGERALDRSEGGLGIGLTIAKSLCDMHGGTIDARSAGPGKGSTFVVMLPRARPATAAPRAGESARATERMPAIATGTRVLVVDDNVDAAHMLRDFLQALGHEPAIAYDAPSALELVARFRPDIAVVDIGLPVMNGYELARRLREQLGREKLRLIAVTGYGQDTDRARAFAVGFDHHLIKPIELDALLSLLGKN